MKKGSLKLSVLFITLLVITIIFKDKYIYLAPDLNISISSFIYAFTFLIPIIMINKSKLKDAKNIINISTLTMFLFIILITILCSIPANLDSQEIELSLRTILAPNKAAWGNFIIHYPDLNILGLIIVYYFSHSILISIYEALNTYTNKYLSYSLSLFIAFIIDTMFMIPILKITDIYYANLNMLDIVKSLTANFMVVIVTSLLMILIFSIYIYPKEKKNL
ncbi:MAG: hypothetical protein GX265_01315 [Mollicutes bacterium]|nr:hypothetical protein [Mollicutes bacterium]